MTAEDVTGIATPNLCKLPEGFGFLIVSEQVGKISKFFNTDWDTTQCMMCGQVLYESCQWLTVAEFKFFTNRIKTGFYHSQKNLSPAIVSEWFFSFKQEILKARESAKERWKPPPESEQMPLEDFSKHIAKMVEVCKSHSPEMAEKKYDFGTFERAHENIQKMAKNGEI